MKSILIVEDDQQLVDLYARKFRAIGYTVATTMTAEEGLQHIKGGNVPDIVLLDIMLPGGMNGFDLLEELKRTDAYRHIPVIMLTNLDGEEETARKVGASDYIIKANTSLEDVVSKVQSFVGGGTS